MNRTSGMTRALRGGLAVLAVLAAAWFFIGARQAHELDGASNLIGHQAGNTTRASDQTLALLHSADLLLPGNQADLLRASLALQRRQYPTAKRLIGYLKRFPSTLPYGAIRAAHGQDRILA